MTAYAIPLHRTGYKTNFELTRIPFRRLLLDLRKGPS